MALVALAGLLAACTTAADEPTQDPDAAATPAEEVVTGGALAVVLPAADGLAPAESVRVRLLVEQALADAAPPVPGPFVLDPATRDTFPSAVELAARRVGPGGTVCVLGGAGPAALDAALARYPGVRGCLLPAPERQATSAPDAPEPDAPEPDAAVTAQLAVAVDLGALGRALGLAARAAAGDGGVVVLAGDDAMLDRRWRAGVVEAARIDGPEPAGTHVVTRAEALLALLDAQDALLAAGTVPGDPLSEDEIASGESVPGGAPSAAPIARTLPPVAVVVLDGSPEAAALVDPLAERGVAVVGPTSLLPAGDGVAPGAVLRWHVRWDVALRTLLRRVGGEDAPTPSSDDLLVLEPGTATVP